MPKEGQTTRSKKKEVVAKEEAKSNPKRSRISQNLCPLFSLEDALRVPRAIKNELAGQANNSLLVAKACDMSPTSSQWRVLSSAAVAYGLTTGAYNSKEIGLTPLGSRAVSPLKEGDDGLAIREAALVPSLFKKLAQKYDQEKLPREDIAYNVIISLGIPSDRVKKAWSIFKSNMEFVGFLQIISGNNYLICHSANEDLPANVSNSVDLEAQAQDEADLDIELPQDIMRRMNITPDSAPVPAPPSPPAIPNIFISHGKNSSTIVGQLKELISYGQMNPIVSLEHETSAIPVPIKVFDDMRSCDAGIIHVNQEEHTLADGTVYTQINENVLIEIGAAMALYADRVILLCEKGTKLPSNLQGLYRCEYTGNQLDYASTIKLLKAMQEIREKITKR